MAIQHSTSQATHSKAHQSLSKSVAQLADSVRHLLRFFQSNTFCEKWKTQCKNFWVFSLFITGISRYQLQVRVCSRVCILNGDYNQTHSKIALAVPVRQKATKNTKRLSYHTYKCEIEFKISLYKTNGKVRQSDRCLMYITHDLKNQKFHSLYMI